jgi:hypothetical protein
MKEDLGNVQLGFIRQNHRAQQMLRGSGVVPD